MKISKKHLNRQHHNWLAYDIRDSFLKENTDNLKGVLYDFGCGEAPYKDFFLKYVKEYIGVDWSNSLHNTKADIVADLNKPLSIDSNVADTIVSLSVLEHLSEPQIMLNEAHRVLKRSGTIILQVPWQWWVHEKPYDFFRYTPYGLEYMFKKAGFKDIVIKPSSGFFTMWFLKINYFTKRFIRGPRALRFIIKIFLIPFWFLLQKLAPLLDKIDKNWSLETMTYYVIAKK